MVYIPAGKFVMGSVNSAAERHEGPEIEVEMPAFWIDKTEVTNAQYRAFVEATGYITVAERDIDWEEISKEVAPGTPRPHDSILAAGSLVFTPTDKAVPLEDYSQWWRWVVGANWRHPEGPNSDIKDKDNYPVVHIAFEDALAYADWIGKSLPTEAQWEYAGRAKTQVSNYSWGNELTPNGQYLANFFQGEFPYSNTGADGFIGAAPVMSYAADQYGLYDMIGNVWEWTLDKYRPDTYAQRVSKGGARGCYNPAGPSKSYDPMDPYATDKRVVKGGSFLCSEQYCSNYRPSSRMATSTDSGQNHLGFRCIKKVKN